MAGQRHLCLSCSTRSGRPYALGGTRAERRPNPPRRPALQRLVRSGRPCGGALGNMAKRRPTQCVCGTYICMYVHSSLRNQTAGRRRRGGGNDTRSHNHARPDPTPRTNGSNRTVTARGGPGRQERRSGRTHPRPDRPPGRPRLNGPPTPIPAPGGEGEVVLNSPSRPQGARADRRPTLPRRPAAHGLVRSGQPCGGAMDSNELGDQGGRHAAKRRPAPPRRPAAHGLVRSGQPCGGARAAMS